VTLVASGSYRSTGRSSGTTPGSCSGPSDHVQDLDLRRILSLGLGLAIAIIRIQKHPLLRWIAIGFIDIFRAVPLLVLLI
jgi:glutamate transport system permease protein